MAYWLSSEPKVDGGSQDYEREEPYATWLKEFYVSLKGKESAERLGVPRPLLVRGDDKKYRWNNFGDVCQVIKRDGSHVTAWLGAELSNNDLLMTPDGSVLTFPKRIREDQLATLLTTYLRLYVLCPKCKRGPTLLTKVPSLRKTLMACVRCGDLGAMPPILKGYKATAKGERKRERRK